MTQEKKIFAVESVCTFFEVHLVEAESEEQAKKIAENSDYNVSKWLGSQVSNVSEYKSEDLERYQKLDSYFFDGYAAVDDDGFLFYRKMNGEVNGNMPRTQIFESNEANNENNA